MIRRIAARVRRALRGPAVPASVPDELDLFRGYHPEDEQRIAALMLRNQQPDPAVFTDAFGVKVDPAYCPWVSAGTVETGLPFPHGYLCDGIEFASAAIALVMAAGRKTFTAVELGAGWGPWTSMMALTAERLGFTDIRLAAFEADPGRFEVLRRHLALNGVAEPRFGKLALFRAAAWWRDETLYWPRNADPQDAGLAVASGAPPAHDYRGKAFAFDEIPARALGTALADWPPIDFLHIDIQGGEWDLVSNSLDYLAAHVRTMFIGTHSRKIEGDLIDLLYRAGWMLVRERPCRFAPSSAAPTLVGRTFHDGGQFWRNERLAS